MSLLAQRSGLDLAFFTNPAAYLAAEETAATTRQATALAELARLYSPPAELLARVEREAEAVKLAHALVAVQGIPALLAQVEQSANFAWQTAAPVYTEGHAARFTAYHSLIAAALADAQRAAGATKDAPAVAFFNQAAASLLTLENALANPPADNAPAATWRAYLQGVRLALSSQNQSVPFHQSVASSPSPLSLSPLTARPRPPYASRLEYWRGEGRPAASPAAPLLSLFNMPGNGDLAETPDVHFTADVQALVAGLQSPVAIFNYVHDNVYPDLYYGSKKGSTGTLYEMAGNDFDQASLLIALYRAAGIPARYATGRVWLSAEQARDLTNTTDSRAASTALRSAGIPTIYVNRPGLDPVVEIEHTWVQVWLPYDSYRGILAGPTASSWINVDPFIKRYSFSTPVDLTNAVAFNPDAYLSTLTETLPVELWENELRLYVQANDLECTTWAAASRVRTILPDNLELLPAELPVIHLNTLATPSELPAGQRYTITLSLQDSQGNVEFSHLATLPEIYGRRIDLTYPAATVADQNLIDSYGGLLNTPPYLVDLRPTLSISETVVASGGPLHAGNDRLLVATFASPGLVAATNQITHRTQAGGIYVVGLDYQSVPQRLIDAAMGRTAGLSGDSLAAQQLHLALLAYFRSFNRGRDDVTGILQSGYIRDVGAGFATRPVQASYLFGAPSSLASGGYFLDVPKLSFAFYDLEGGQERAGEVTKLVGYNSSALEHLVWQYAFGYHTISAVKALQLAAEDGQTIHTVSSAGQVPGLGVSQEVKNALLDALNRGWFAKVSQNPITFYNWSGSGYVIYDPTTGAAGYMISGGLNGAQTVQNAMDHLLQCGRNGYPFGCGDLSAGDIIAGVDEFLALFGGGSYGGYGGGSGGSGFPPGSGGSPNFAGALTRIDQFITKLKPGSIGFSGGGERRDAGGSIVGDPVNLSNGNMFQQVVDLPVMARGLPVVFDRTYNSLVPLDGRLGWGWSDGLAMQIVAGDDGSRTVVYSDGATYLFTPDGLGGFERPAGFHYSLTETAGGYSLEHVNGFELTFDPDGLLLSMADPNGNSVSLNYSAGRLQSATDAAGQTVLNFSYNGSGRISSVSDDAGRTVLYGYDAAGNLTSVTDLRGHTTSYSYDANHRLLTITDPAGNSHRFAYDGLGQLYRHADPLGNVESFSYDPYNRRAVVTDAAGNDTIYTLDNLGRVLSRTDALGNQSQNRWDADHNLVGVVDSLGNQLVATYDGDGNALSFVDQLGHSVSYAYNSRGQIISQTQVVSTTVLQTLYSYDASGNLASLTPATAGAGNVLNYSYDGDGQLLQASNAASGGTINYSYNPDGTVANMTLTAHDADGAAANVTQVYGYGPSGLPTSLQSGDGRTYTLDRDAAGAVEAVAGPDGSDRLLLQYDESGRLSQAVTLSAGGNYSTSYQLDGLGRVIGQTDNAGHSTSMSYNSLGQVASVTDPGGNVTRFEYDALGRLLRQFNPDGTMVAVGYCADATESCAWVDENGYLSSREEDALGRTTSLSDPLGHTVYYEYDEMGRVVRVEDAEGHVSRYLYNDEGLYQVVDGLNQVTSYDYDGLGNLIGLTDGNSHSRSFDYDELGQLIRATDALGNLTRTYYDGAGRTRKVIDANGATINFSYDVLGRLSSISGPSGLDNFIHNSLGRLTQQSNTNTTQTYSYDLLGRMTAATQVIGGSTKNVQYSYTPEGAVASFTNAEGQVTRYQYDARGRLVSIVDPSGGWTTFDYDAGGRRVQISLPNGVTTYYSYDATGRTLAQVSRSADNQVVAAFSYGYDDNGRRTAVTDLAGRTTSYSYDALGRLTNASYGDGRSESFTYDPVGNRLTRTLDGVLTSYSYNSGDRLTSETTAGNTTNYTYDNNGNLLTRSTPGGPVTYSYSHHNQLTGILLPDGSAWSFGYDASGNRLFEQFAPSSGPVQRTDFLVTGGNVLADYRGSTVSHYLRGPGIDEVLGQETAGQWSYFVSDDMGSIAVISDEQGQVVNRRSYDAFGSVGPASDTVWPTRYGYTGREAIGNTGLMHYRARTYDPAAGRFTSVDPEFGFLEAPQSLHRYSYVMNDPVNLRDPSGRTAQDVFGKAFFSEIVVPLGSVGYAGLIEYGKTIACGLGLVGLCVGIITADISIAMGWSFISIADYPQSHIQHCACLYTFLGGSVLIGVTVYLSIAPAKLLGDILNTLMEKVLIATADKFIQFIITQIIKFGSGSAYLAFWWKLVLTGIRELIKAGYDYTNLGKAGASVAKLFLAPEIGIGLCEFFYWVGAFVSSL